jgi:phosphinothricin acetyltransferase
MGNVIVREAVFDDLEAIVEIYNQAVSEGGRTGDLSPLSTSDRKDWFKSHTPNHFPIFVAELNNKVIGWLSLSPYRAGRQAFAHSAEISYYIDYNHHKMGIASKLIQHAVASCPKIGIEILFAILLECNSASKKLLQKHGFEQWGCLPDVAKIDGQKVSHLYYGLKVN